jgi:non-ribosomal peptide synthetase component F
MKGGDYSPDPSTASSSISLMLMVEEFWTLQLNNLNAAIFPSLARTEYSPEPDRSFSHMMTNLPDHKKNYTLSSVIQLAWALVLAHYTDSEDVVFGLTVNGRTASLFGITEVTGPTIATIPYRVKLSQEKTVHDSLSDLQRQSTRMIPFLQHGLQHIRKLGPDAAKACEFVSHALTMICHMQDDSSDLRITVNYDPSVLQDTEARRLVHQFQAVVHQLSANPHCAIRDVQVISAEDLTQLAAWNGQVPSATHETLHDLILRQIAGQPDAEAVCAWDGELTYQQLGDYSALLAQHFLTLGISPESRIAICLEKSRWTIVILLGALRAGAACVLLDPAYPRQRIEQLVKKTVPQLLLASQTHGNLAQCLGTRGIVSGEAFIRSLAPLSIDLPDISPSQAAFILFTSGSTGKSKAIIMEHVNLSSSICAHSSALNLSSTSRSLHFASYAFDASIYEIFDTLICGGCVCIPSEVSHFGKENSASGLDCTIRFPYITVHDTLASYSPVEARVIKFPAPVVSQ